MRPTLVLLVLGALRLQQTAAASCPVGYYPVTGVLQCEICFNGFYCPGGTSPEIACPAGTYGSQTGLSTASCTGQCGAGYWGTVQQLSRTCSGFCDAGYWGGLGQTASTCSGQCNAGSWGSPGQSSPSCSGLCIGGYWGGAGQTSPTCSGQCSAVRAGHPLQHGAYIARAPPLCAGLLLPSGVYLGNAEPLSSGALRIRCFGREE